MDDTSCTPLPKRRTELLLDLSIAIMMLHISEELVFFSKPLGFLHCLLVFFLLVSFYKGTGSYTKILLMVTQWFTIILSSVYFLSPPSLLKQPWTSKISHNRYFSIPSIALSLIATTGCLRISISIATNTSNNMTCRQCVLALPCPLGLSILLSQNPTYTYVPYH